MALVGLQAERNRIDAAVAEIQNELGNVHPGRITSPATTSQSATPRKRHFSAAARKRMARAQRKRCKLLKAEQAGAKRAKPKPTVKRRKTTSTPTKTRRTAPARATKKPARTVAKAASKTKVKTVVPEPNNISTEVPKALDSPVVPQEAVELTPATE